MDNFIKIILRIALQSIYTIANSSNNPTKWIISPTLQMKKLRVLEVELLLYSLLHSKW
jgi:hypothetical protein